MSDLTQEELKRLFYYDPETGDFIRRVRTSSNANVGGIAGGSNKHGYRIIKINNKSYAAHRLAFLYMQGILPRKDLQTDHCDHNRGNNIWSNLRLVTNQENAKNCSMPRNNTTGCVGVTWNKCSKKWRATIVVNGKNKHLGYFQDKADAVLAREAANKQFGYHKNHGKQKEGAA